MPGWTGCGSSWAGGGCPCLWEQGPDPDFGPSSCLQVALEGLRPTIPPGISPHICKLMKICMNEDPAKRPKFDMIVPILEKMQEK